MQQTFGTDNHYIQDDECGYEILFVPFGLQVLVRILVHLEKLSRGVGGGGRKLVVKKLGGHH